MRLVRRVNGKLVALKVIRLQEEEGTPFTAIREGKETMRCALAPNTQVAFELKIWKNYSVYLMAERRVILTCTDPHTSLNLSCSRIREAL